MRPTRVVVVVLPAEPVMPITGQGTLSMNSCESLVTGIFLRRASSMSGKCQRYTAGDAHQVGAIQQGQWMTAKDQFRPGGRPGRPLTEACSRLRFPVIQGHLRAMVDQVASQSLPLTGCTDDQNVFTGPIFHHVF